MAQGRRHEPRARRLDAHRRPDARHLRRQRHRRCGSADRGGRGHRRAAAPRRHRGGRVLRRRRGRARHVPRSGEPRRGVAAAGDLLLREQRVRGVLARVRRSTRRTLEQRAAGYGVDYVAVDGNDVVATATRDARRWSTACAPGAVPSSSRPPPTAGTVTTKATRERYRTPDEMQEWEARDPLVIGARHLRDAGVDDDALDGARTCGVARSSTPPSRPRVGCRHRRSRRSPTSSLRARPERAEPPALRPPTRRCSAPWTRSTTRSKRSSRPTSACSSPASTSPRAATCSGSPAACTTSSATRVRDTPISESAIVGLGVGAAMAGMRPVVELMYLDFLGVCLDQLLNQAAKLPFMTGGAAQMALTVRTQFGAGRSSGSQHSQSLEALLAHIPGLTVVMPSTPADTYGLLRAAIQDPNPVVFIENRLLYGMKGPQPPADHLRADRPGRDRAARAPTSPSCRCRAWCTTRVAAAEAVAADGISVEVIDLRTVAPLDTGTDPRVGAQDEPAAHRARGGGAVRHRRRDRGDRRARRLLEPRRSDRAHRRRSDTTAVRTRARTGVVARHRRHRRCDPTCSRASDASSRGRGR